MHPPGSQKLRRIILDDELGICADLDKEMDFLIGSYEDEWQKTVLDPELRKTFKQFVNTVRSLSLLPSAVSLTGSFDRTNARRRLR